MRSNEWKNKVKKMLAVAMMAMMLLGSVGASSDTGVMPCGELVESIIEEL